MRRIVVLLLGCSLALYVGVKIPENPIGVLILLGALGYILTLAVNSHALAWLVVATMHSALIVPGFPGRPFWFEAAAAALWVSFACHWAINRGRFENVDNMPGGRGAIVSLMGYVAVLVVLMFVHGVGFRAFGGEQMGGRFYLQQVVLSPLPVVFLMLRWKPRALMAAFFTGAALALTYLVSDLALIYGGRVGNFLLFFLEVPTDAVNFYLGFEMFGLRRLQSFASVGVALFSVLLVCFPLRWMLHWRGIWMAPLLALALGLGLASGHRTVLVQLAATCVLLIIWKRLYTPIRLVMLLAVVSVGTIGLYLLAPKLPLGMQRSISVLPGIQVSQVARDDAYATVRDRVEILQLGVRDIPQHWLIGRGFGMNRFDVAPPDIPGDAIYQAYQEGYFYNGLLGLLLKTGLPGLMAAFGFVWYVSRAGLASLRRINEMGLDEEALFVRFTQLVVAKWFAVVIFFFTLHGDAGAFLQQTAVPAALVLGCTQIWQRRWKQKAEET